MTWGRQCSSSVIYTTEPGTPFFLFLLLYMFFQSTKQVLEYMIYSLEDVDFATTQASIPNQHQVNSHDRGY